MAVVDFYVIADKEFDITMWIDGALTVGDVGINSVADMVDKLTKKCATGDKIGTLQIFGHGNDNGQYIGENWVSKFSLPGVAADLRKLRPHFGRGAEVIMAGCQQGQNGGLLLALSDLLNVRVSGFTALQRPALPGDEGGRTTCFITCTREGQTTADEVDKVQMIIMEKLLKIIN